MSEIYKAAPKIPKLPNAKKLNPLPNTTPRQQQQLKMREVEQRRVKKMAKAPKKPTHSAWGGKAPLFGPASKNGKRKAGAHKKGFFGKSDNVSAFGIEH